MTNSQDFINQVYNGDCTKLLSRLPSESVDLVVTDPPYLVNYITRDGRTVSNDRNGAWLRPAFAEIYRVLKQNRMCVSFYGWQLADEFLSAWREAGFRPVGHIVWTKNYASRKGYLAGHHEAAYLLAKGRPQQPHTILPDVLEWHYTGNKLHPTEKPVESLAPLISAFSKHGDVVLDPFAGSGTTCVAAKKLFRRYIGIELEEQYCAVARARLDKFR